MRVFTDGACSRNGRPGAKAGYAVWFPDHPEWSVSQRLPEGEAQTNQRAELNAIQHAIRILDDAGEYDRDVIVYTDSEYSIQCLTKWIPGWVARGWKTSEGKDVLHQDLIKDISGRIAKFKSHRFVHVRAHTGQADELSRHNDTVDRMARSTIDETVKLVEPPAIDDLFPGCPLRLLGPPVAQTELLQWIRTHVSELDSEIVNKHLYKAFVELCKARDVTLTKQIVSKTPVVRAERCNLQRSVVTIEKVE